MLSSIYFNGYETTKANILVKICHLKAIHVHEFFFLTRLTYYTFNLFKLMVV